MTQILVPPTMAPPRTPLRGGLLDVADVRQAQHLGGLDGQGLWPSLACVDTNHRAVAFCQTSPSKTFVAPSWISGKVITLYAGVSCRTVGFDPMATESELRDSFLASESVGYEAALLSDILPLGTAPVSLGTAIPLAELTTAIGALEGYAATHYAGAATLHIPANMAALLCSLHVINRDDSGVWHTCLGSKVSLGGGYIYNRTPTGAATAAGLMWLYVTGETVIEQGALNVRTVVDTVKNDVYILAERSSLMAVDCLKAGVSVVVPASMDPKSSETPESEDEA